MPSWPPPEPETPVSKTLTPPPIPTGYKGDEDKPDWSLVDFEALEGMVWVLMYGARKYEPDNWKFVKGAVKRYGNATLRHLFARMRGEVYDAESGLPHIDHFMCNAFFLAWFALKQGNPIEPAELLARRKAALKRADELREARLKGR